VFLGFIIVYWIYFLFYLQEWLYDCGNMYPPFPIFQGRGFIKYIPNLNRNKMMRPGLVPLAFTLHLHSFSYCIFSGILFPPIGIRSADPVFGSVLKSIWKISQLWDLHPWTRLLKQMKICCKMKLILANCFFLSFWFLPFIMSLAKCLHTKIFKRKVSHLL
jgi:hypothetical protein